MPNPRPQIPEAVEAVAEVLARIYTDGEDDLPNAFAEADENLREEWRGDARAVLAVLPPQSSAAALESLAKQMERNASASAIVDGPMEAEATWLAAARVVRSHLEGGER